MCTRPKLVDVTHAYFFVPGLSRKYKFAPCGMCLECRNMRREEYTQRLKHEIQTSGYIASFVSLTYRDEELPLLSSRKVRFINSSSDEYDYEKCDSLISQLEGDDEYENIVLGKYFGSVPPAYGSTLSRKDISNFCDKLQKRFHRKFGKKRLKYIAVGEYGDDGHRPHYHLIIVGLPCSERQMVYEAWNKGRVDVEPVGNGAIRYCLEYIDKQVYGANALYEYYGDFEPPFAHFSKGIGADWIKANLSKFDKFGRIKFDDSGKSYTLNPYYRRKYKFDVKPYVTPFSDSVVKFAVDNRLDLFTAYKKRCELVERSLVHRQIKKREPITQCSKYMIQQEISRLKNKGLYENPEVARFFTQKMLQPDEYTIHNKSDFAFMDSVNSYQLFKVKPKIVYSYQVQKKLRN